MIFAPEVETQALLKYIESLGDVLLSQAVDGNPEALRALANKDIKDNAFQRGYLMGMAMVLRCGGISAYLSGEQIQTINRRFAVIAQDFKIKEFIEAERAQ